MSLEDKAKELIDKTNWVFAKTYKDFAPHEYVTRAKNPLLFQVFEELMELKGEVRYFKFPGGQKPYKYVVLGELKYWFTSPPYPAKPQESFILNRDNAKVSKALVVE